MPVEIEISGNLSPDGEKHQTMNLENEMTVKEVLTLLEINPELVGLIVIDGIQSDLEDNVPSNSRLCIYPYLSGG